MTQLFPILLVAVVLIAESGITPAGSAPPAGTVTAVLVALGPVTAILLAAAAGLRWCGRRLDRAGAVRPIVVADRIIQAGRLLLLVNHAVATLLVGWLAAVREATGNLVLLDEIVAILPPVIGATVLSWLHYPIERRLREALLVRQLDQGRPVYQIPSRGQYVGQFLRVHMLLLLVPVLTILCLAETIRLLASDRLPAWATDVATMVAGVGVFAFAPLMARVVLSVEPLAPGLVRDDLLEICRRHRIRIREFFLWKTHGSMINAAVMGLVRPLRYVLLTDSLVDTMPREQVRAVMAHEIGHVRRHHMPWLVSSLLAMLMLAGFLVTIPLFALDRLDITVSREALQWIDGGATAAAGLIALVGFGWVSRRYERQADVFAVQHLSGLGCDADPPAVPARDEAAGSDAPAPVAPVPDEHAAGVPGAAETPALPPAPPPPPRTVTVEAVASMHGALEAVARLNGVDPRRKSWRHGSIAWRQAYLVSLIGRPLDGLPIDRLIRWTKVVVAVILLLGGGLVVALERQEPRRRHPGERPPIPLRMVEPSSIAHGEPRT